MTKFGYSIGLLACGLFLGQMIKVVIRNQEPEEVEAISKYLRRMQMVALLCINPIVSLGAFWIVRLNDIKFIALPILGFSAISIGGILGIKASRLLGHERRETGSMFVSGAFTNMGNFGGLICFVFFGEASYAFVSMYRLFEEFAYYMIGYPIARLFGSKEGEKEERHIFLRIISDPFIMVSFISIAIGVTLNMSGLERPLVYQALNEVLIPLSTILLVTVVGYNMKVKAIGRYLRECLTIASIKFFIIPITITTAAYLLGIGELQNGLILKIILVMSSMPPAFNSLIPPQIYDLDVDIANSCWLFCTGSLIIVLPVLNILIGVI